MSRPEWIEGHDADRTLLDRLAERAAGCEQQIGLALQLAIEMGTVVPEPGAGSTAALWSALSSVAAVDVTVARVVEPHLDALAILSQASATGGLGDLSAIGANERSTWGVFAAEAAGMRLVAAENDAVEHDAAENGGTWRLSGTKPWCSLAGSLSHALVTAHTGDSTRRLFAIALKQPGVVVREGAWHATGLASVASGPVDFDAVEAIPVGEDGWYLQRPGFAWGGIGVAACWFGGAVGVARRAFLAAREREPDQIGLMHLGALDTEVHAARVALALAARIVDDPATTREQAEIVALRTRNIVARASEEVVQRVGHALGPAPLALENEHARRVADLQIYVRQHHAERDHASLGRKLLAALDARW